MACNFLEKSLRIWHFMNHIECQGKIHPICYTDAVWSTFMGDDSGFYTFFHCFFSHQLEHFILNIHSNDLSIFANHLRHGYGERP